MNFDLFSFDPRIVQQLHAVGFEKPTPIQEQAIPVVLEGRDVLGLAQTGTGKTAAFMLPILQRFTQGPLRRTRALVVVPTRELAEQIYQTSVDLGRKTHIRSTAIYGGVGKTPQVKVLKSGVEIVVACPGRLLDLHSEGNIDLSRVEVLVLDEADRMCDMGFLPDVRRILKLLPTKRQTLFFSATMPEDIRKLSNDILHDPVTVQIGMIAPAKTVSHSLYPVTNNLKKKLLFAMLRQTQMDQVLIFTRTKRRARFLASDLDKKGYNVTALQGNMAQNRRQQAIDGFRSGKYKILVATDIAARGIDVTEISHVINFDMPDTVDAYTHRIGRTGRAEQTGEAYTFAVHDDAEMVREIEKTLDMEIERRSLPNFDYSGFEPERQFPHRNSGRNQNGQRQNRQKQNGRKRNSRRQNEEKPIKQQQPQSHNHPKKQRELASPNRPPLEGRTSTKQRRKPTKDQRGTTSTQNEGNQTATQSTLNQVKDGQPRRPHRIKRRKKFVKPR
ncbi:DEAD/DEAH box helicase [Chloroflexi bacterium TSY]|nr:DEAD/DEAH box helicase [Chloroflexi bacterium TSY]